MDNRIREAFAYVKAEEKLKEQTLLFIKKKRPGKKTILSHPRLRPVLAACCALLVFAGSFGSYHVYETEAALISIDINPSIELEVNRFGRVIRQTAYGKKGEEVLQPLSLKNLPYGQAVKTLLSSPGLEPYLTDGATVSVTLGTKDSEDAVMLDQLETCVTEAVSSHHQGVELSYCHVDMDEADRAHAEGISMGNYCAGRHERQTRAADEPPETAAGVPQTSSSCHDDGCSHHDSNGGCHE